MKALFGLVMGSAGLDDRSLVVHLVAKTLIVTAALVVLWALEYQAEVVYEAF